VFVELLSPTRLLFTSQVKHEHRESWWNIDRDPLIRKPELPGKPTNRVIQ
jgi:hypothetical protein